MVVVVLLLLIYSFFHEIKTYLNVLNQTSVYVGQETKNEKIACLVKSLTFSKFDYVVVNDLGWISLTFKNVTLLHSGISGRGLHDDKLVLYNRSITKKNEFGFYVVDVDIDTSKKKK